MKKTFIKGSIDGFLQAIVLACCGAFLASSFALNFSLKQYLWIGVTGALISAIVFAVLMRKESNNETIIYTFLISMFFEAVGIAMLIVLRITHIVDLWPVREVNNADGISLIFFVGCFVVAAIVLKTCICVVLIIKNVHQAQRNKT